MCCQGAVEFLRVHHVPSGCHGVPPSAICVPLCARLMGSSGLSRRSCKRRWCVRSSKTRWARHNGRHRTLRSAFHRFRASSIAFERPFHPRSHLRTPSITTLHQPLQPPTTLPPSTALRQVGNIKLFRNNTLSLEFQLAMFPRLRPVQVAAAPIASSPPSPPRGEQSPHTQISNA